MGEAPRLPDIDWELWLGRAWKAALAALLVFILVWLNRVVPPQHLPWKPLDPEAPVGLATRAQLMRVAVSPSATCRELAESFAPLDSVEADPRRGDGPCGFEVARVVSAVGDVELAGQSSMQCPLSVGVAIWLREADRIAQERLGEPLARVHHYGSYSCRRMYGRSSGRWSEHAFANAWDVASFETESGNVVSLKGDWGGGGERAAFLREVRDAACDVFRVTLGPDYNAAHADHFHVDMGPSSTCR